MMKMTKQEFIDEIISYIKNNGDKLNKEAYIKTILNSDAKCIIAKYFEPLLNNVIFEYLDFFSGNIPNMEDIYEDVLLKLIKYLDNKVNNKTTYEFSVLELDIIEDCIKEGE